MVKKNLHNRVHFEEIIHRISGLSENSKRKWGKMDVCQMMRHCNLVLQIPLKRLELPAINPLFGTIGRITKIEMQIFNNGIPRNMPTFQKLIINFDCEFDNEKQNLLKTLDEYWNAFKNTNLPDHHVLFGKMKEKDWGFLEFKHLDHHLKQFNV
ncbi:Protein of unknown function [Chryseobacterium sp. RU37D]|uniref:DUF1569 domain-containing protein n=1 Tax=Chryseobacterium sp. RU37D TaxID=1907397 RepID=UPI0009563F6E|nr:DUF1569 domain-containing protein [Chryseobacterium sp. RU37D]SIQ82333.1 Protein of unknown function [Chryseobacterium sp. RU37D]